MRTIEVLLPSQKTNKPFGGLFKQITCGVTKDLHLWRIQLERYSKSFSDSAVFVNHRAIITAIGQRNRHSVVHFKFLLKEGRDEFVCCRRTRKAHIGPAD